MSFDVFSSRSCCLLVPRACGVLTPSPPACRRVAMLPACRRFRDRQQTTSGGRLSLQTLTCPPSGAVLFGRRQLTPCLSEFVNFESKLCKQHSEISQLTIKKFARRASRDRDVRPRHFPILQGSEVDDSAYDVIKLSSSLKGVREGVVAQL